MEVAQKRISCRYNNCLNISSNYALVATPRVKHINVVLYWQSAHFVWLNIAVGLLQAGVNMLWGERRGAYRVLVGRPEGKRPLGRPRRRWKNNIKMDLQGVGWGNEPPCFIKYAGNFLTR